MGEVLSITTKHPKWEFEGRQLFEEFARRVLPSLKSFLVTSLIIKK